jgi:hypothetical protein
LSEKPNRKSETFNGLLHERREAVKADHREEIFLGGWSFDRLKLSEILRKNNLKSVTFGIEAGNHIPGFMSFIQRLQSNVLEVE